MGDEGMEGFAPTAFQEKPSVRDTQTDNALVPFEMGEQALVNLIPNK